MALKDFDYKQFLLEKGERVGLYVAGGLGILLIFLSLIWPGGAIFHASPKPAAKELRDSAQDKQQRVAMAAPQGKEIDDLRRVDPQLLKQASSVAEDPANFRLFAEMFAPRDVQSSKRRLPDILGPEEFQVAVVPAQVNNYMMKQTNNTLWVGILTNSNKGASKPGKPGGSFGDRFGQFYSGGSSGGRPGGGGGMGSGSGMMGPGGPGGGDQRGFYGPGGGSGGGGVFGDDKKNQEVKYVTKEELDKMSSPEFARDLRPQQMAIIAAAFPFKAQVAEFQKALRADSPYRVVFEEKVTEKDKKGQEIQKQAFRFAGFRVERRTVGPEGKPGDWAPLDFGRDGAYGQLMAQVLNEAAPEDAKVQKLLVPGLYQRRPVQVPVKDKDTLAAKPYPDVELELPKIKETLAKLNPQEKAPITGNSKFDKSAGFDAFGGDEPPPAEGDSSAPPTPSEWAPADYCLLRFLDVTIQPGNTYEYRVKVRMANPNYNRPDADVAYPDVKKDKELESDKWYDVKGPDGKVLRVSVPTDLHFYSVDEQALKKKDYKGMNANKTHDATRQTVVQVHYWMDFYELTRGSKTEFFPVGDWVVGERMFVYRGESLSARALTHVPIWSPEHSNFILGGKPPASGRDRRPVEDVTFIKDRSRAPLLVDFEGGNVTYHRRAVAAAKAEDGTPEEGSKATPAAEIRAPGTTTELLFLTADGKLVARDSAHDENDTERAEREKSYVERVEKAEGKPQEPPKPMP
jgi:hypothetical protein